MLDRENRPSTTLKNLTKNKAYIPKNKIGESGKTRSEREEYRKLYKNRKYLKIRKIFMAKHPFCEICGRPATDLDHIVPHRGNLKLFWDQKNWQALCHSCHSKKTKRGE